MKLHSYLMLNCILPDDQTQVNEFSKLLATAIQQYRSNIHIDLKTNIKYWKYLDSRQLIFNISSDKPLSVEDLIKAFNVTWVYSRNCVFDLVKQQKLNEEEAIWNQSMNPHENFLGSNIEWVHIYTWLDW